MRGVHPFALRACTARRQHIKAEGRCAGHAQEPHHGPRTSTTRVRSSDPASASAHSTISPRHSTRPQALARCMAVSPPGTTDRSSSRSPQVASLSCSRLSGSSGRVRAATPATISAPPYRCLSASVGRSRACGHAASVAYSACRVACVDGHQWADEREAQQVERSWVPSSAPPGRRGCRSQPHSARGSSLACREPPCPRPP